MRLVLEKKLFPSLGLPMSQETRRAVGLIRQEQLLIVVLALANTKHERGKGVSRLNCSVSVLFRFHVVVVSVSLVKIPVILCPMARASFGGVFHACARYCWSVLL